MALETGVEPGDGVAVLVGTVLPWVDELYRRHAALALAVSEGPVQEVLAEARRALGGEIRGGRSLLGRGGAEPFVTSRDNCDGFKSSS